MGNEWTRLAPTETQLMEQALALADADGYVITLGEVMTEQLAVPKVLRMAEFVWQAAKVPVKPLKLSFAEEAWSSRAGRFLQSRKTARLKALNPVFHRARTLAKEI